MVERKGARSRKHIAPEVQAALDAGTMETASLPEALAVDFQKLMCAVAPRLGTAAREQLDPAQGIVRRMQLAGLLLHEQEGLAGVERLSKHASDTVRGWACYALAAAPGIPLPERIERFRSLADDRHFGVREWAWLALRPHLTADLGLALEAFVTWTGHASANVRRFAVESVRPRGVWCAHLETLKRDPSPGLPLLEPLKADPSRYVQNSVANWLNDASRSTPRWVRTLCKRWRRGQPAKETLYICKRAMRTLDKQAETDRGE